MDNPKEIMEYVGINEEEKKNILMSILRNFILYIIEKEKMKNYSFQFK